MSHKKYIPCWREDDISLYSLPDYTGRLAPTVPLIEFKTRKPKSTFLVYLWDTFTFIVKNVSVHCKPFRGNEDSLMLCYVIPSFRQLRSCLNMTHTTHPQTLGLINSTPHMCSGQCQCWRNKEIRLHIWSKCSVFQSPRTHYALLQMSTMEVRSWP